MTRICVLLMLLSLAGPIVGQQDQRAHEKLADTGGAFLKTCAVIEKPTKQLTSSELLDANYCAAYMAGFVDALQVTAELYREPLACFPETLDARDAMRIVLAYIREKPERRERTTAVLVGAALARAFPCQK